MFCKELIAAERIIKIISHGNTAFEHRAFSTRNLITNGILKQHSISRPCSKVLSRSMSSPKVEEDTAKEEKKPASGWVAFMKAHQEEFVNILLASFLLIITLRMLREKGEKLEEKKEVEAEIGFLKTELNRVRKELDDFSESGLPKIVRESGLKSGKAESVSAQLAEKIRSIITPPAGSKSVNQERDERLNVPTMQTTVQSGLM